jgi:hypothetical protein
MDKVSVRYIVAKVDAAIPFYTELLGFQVDIHPAPGFASLSQGNLELCLISLVPVGQDRRCPVAKCLPPAAGTESRSRSRICRPPWSGWLRALRRSVHGLWTRARAFCAAGIPEDCVGSTAPATRDSLLRQKAFRRYPIMNVTTPVPVEGGVAGGALPKSAGTSFHGRRKPNGSACQRRTMAGVQEEAKHAIRAMSPLKSCDLEKPQPQR